MSLALLSGANPRVCSQVGPKVRIHEGRFRLNCVGLIDSELTLYSSASGARLLVRDGNEFDGNCSVNLYFEKRGSESHISIFAEEIHGAKSSST